MDLGLAGQVALIVGGSGLIGQATARVLKADGATVVIASRPSEKLDALAAELGVDKIGFDAREDDDVKRAIDEVYTRYGRIDSLVLTSAPSAFTLDSSRDRDPEQILGAIDGKALTFLRVAEEVAPRMVAAGSGRIVGVSGQNAKITASVTGAVRNGALITIGKILADAYAGTGVTVNVVNPGPVRDDATHAAPDAGMPGDSTPDEVAAVLAFLVSPAASGVSGEAIAVGHKVRGVAG